MSECRHGLRSGCAYCHVSRAPEAPAGRKKRSGPAARLADKMNDRMTALKRRLRQLRGE